MSLIKMVNGTPVEMSPDEEAATLAEWAKNEKPNSNLNPMLAARQEQSIADTEQLIAQAGFSSAQLAALTQLLNLVKGVP